MQSNDQWSPSGPEAKRDYLVSRLDWAEQQARAYQHDYESMLDERNTLHKELLQIRGSLKAYRRENAELKRKIAAKKGRLARLLRGRLPDSRSTAPAGNPAAEAVHAPVGSEEQTGSDFKLPARSADPAYTPALGLAMVVADSESRNSAADRAQAAGMEVIVMLRPGYPWDTGRHCEYRGRTCLTDSSGRLTVYSPGADIRTQKEQHFLDLSADAIVREARLHRPALLLSDGSETTSRAVLLAGRRLGIPVGLFAAHGSVLAAEADVDVETLKPLSRTLLPGRKLESLRIGIIADEFTLRLLANTVSARPLDYSGWKEQLEAGSCDALIVESAWLGNQGQWIVSDYYKDQAGYENLSDLVGYCRARGIPTVFWNKEDPIHYRRFRRVATLFDHIVSTDAGSLQFYQDNAGASARTYSSMSFFADPSLHNPVSQSAGEKAVAYAGTFYGERFPERSHRMMELFRASEPYGPAIFDRHHGDAASGKAYPAELAEWVRGGLSYAETLEAYRAFPVHLNFNSAPWSETMFSRRVVEIAASGTVVYSAAGAAVTSCLGSAFPVSNDPEIYRALLQTWMTDERERKATAWRQMRTVYRAHLAGHALAILFRTIGIPAVSPQLPRAAVHVNDLTLELAEALANQSVRPALCLYKTADPAAVEVLALAGVAASEDDPSGGSEAGDDGPFEWHVRWPAQSNRTLLEDLLLGTAFGDWKTISIVDDDVTRSDRSWSPLAQAFPEPQENAALVASLTRRGGLGQGHLVLVYPGS